MEQLNKTFALIFITSALLFACDANEYQEHDVNEQVEISNFKIESPDQFLPLVHRILHQDTLELLRNLCHPDPARIRFSNAYTLCNIGSDDMMEIEKCKNWFGNSSVIDEIKVEVDTAWMPVQLGGGERHPIIILENYNGQWYLVGMEWQR